MAFSEVAPFSKTGGLGDVAGALPKALKDLGHDVRVITPQYRLINERRYVLRDVIRLQNIPVQMGEESVEIQVKSAFLPNSKVQIYFLDYRPYFFREGLYVDPKTGSDYADNAARFILFCKGTLETLKKLQWQPDIIHCNDWQTGIIPMLLKEFYDHEPFFSKTFSLMTIHNFVYQGIYDKSFLSLIGESRKISKMDTITQGDRFNFLRTGLVYADGLNTVSQTYSQEVQLSSEFGCGLEDILRERTDDFKGVTNGLDESVWNPESDPLIETHYGPENPEDKQEAKKVLLEQLELPYDPRIPVIGVTSRLTLQKGFDLIKAVFPELMKLDIYFVLLGTGDKAYESFFAKMQKKYPGKLRVFLKFDETLAHQIAAGADLFLMPSLQEPCGLTQLYSLKYGTVPVVHATGGLADTVKNTNISEKTGTGFTFTKPEPALLLKTVRDAVAAFADSENWAKLVKRGMLEDFSWERSSEKYVELYLDAISKR